MMYEGNGSGAGLARKRAPCGTNHSRNPWICSHLSRSARTVPARACATLWGSAGSGGRGVSSLV